MAVFCDECDGMVLPYPSAPPEQALCRFHKNEGGVGYISRTTWTTEKPYLRCMQMNPRGTCPLFEPKRDNEMEMIDVHAAKSGR